MILMTSRVRRFTLTFITLMSTANCASGQTWREVHRGRFPQITGLLSASGRLIFCDSPDPLSRDGGDLYTWSPPGGAPIRRLTVDEQGLYQVRGYGKNLYIAGADATENWDFGNIYRSVDSGMSWSKLRTVPKAVHVFDICEWRGQVVVGASTVEPNGGTVCFSRDNGQTWTVELVAPAGAKEGDGRVYMAVPTPQGLYAFWQSGNGAAGWKVRTSRGWKPADGDGLPTGFASACTYLADGKVVIALLPRWRQIGSGMVVFGRDAFGLMTSGRDPKVIKIPPIEQTPTSHWLFKNYQDMAIGEEDTLYALTARGVAVGSLKGFWNGEPGFKHLVELPAGQIGWSMVFHAGRLYVGTNAPGGGRLLVLDESAKPMEVFRVR